jgi:hypothetical protein
MGAVRTVDLLAVCAAAVIVITLSTIIVRQRWMLNVGGAIPVAVLRHDGRWSYGSARYFGGELRWYRALGIGSRATRVFRRSQLTLVSRRSPHADELSSLPANAVVAHCRSDGDELVLALGPSAFTGFVSWLEASAPAP